MGVSGSHAFTLECSSRLGIPLSTSQFLKNRFCSSSQGQPHKVEIAKHLAVVVIHPICGILLFLFCALILGWDHHFLLLPTKGEGSVGHSMHLITLHERISIAPPNVSLTTHGNFDNSLIGRFLYFASFL